ncbi:MAG TPA: flagellar export chaperone FliS [Myxococcota bacterium]|nr:flagellar export chaperone FliS [Myxococcota bacterium]
MSNPMKAYQRVRITTASPAELVVMLYDGLARFIGLAADAIDEERWTDAGRNFERAIEIVGHLRDSLDESVSASLVSSLDKTYVLWSRALIKAQLERDAESTRSVAVQVVEVSDSWRQALAQLPSNHPARVGAT